MTTQSRGGAQGAAPGIVAAAGVDGVLHVIMSDGRVLWLRGPQTRYDKATGCYRLAPGEWFEEAPIPGTAAALEGGAVEEFDL